MREEPRNPAAVGYVAAIAARRGDRATAERLAAILATIKPRYSYGWVTLQRARIASLLGDKAGAVDLLRAAMSEGFSDWGTLHTDRDLANLHGYAPFEKLLAPQD